MGWKESLRSEGVRQFAIRLGTFVGALFALYLFIFLFWRHTAFFVANLRIPEQFYLPFLSGLRKSDALNASLFTLVIFLIWNRERILALEAYAQPWKQTLWFSIGAGGVQVAHYLFKFWVNRHLVSALTMVTAVTLSKYVFNVAFVVLLAYAAFGSRFLREQWVRYKRQLPWFLGLMVAYFFIIQGFQTIWRVLGEFVARALAFLLGLTFRDVYLDAGALRAPTLGVGDFVVGISEECSGIDSLLLFISLYTVLLVLDWDRVDRKRMLLLLVPGLVGTVAYNILRVYLLMLVGIYISPEFAVDVFHTNVGWVLFLVFFVIFWHYGSKWVYKRPKKTIK